MHRAAAWWAVLMLLAGSGSAAADVVVPSTETASLDAWMARCRRRLEASQAVLRRALVFNAASVTARSNSFPVPSEHTDTVRLEARGKGWRLVAEAADGGDPLALGGADWNDVSDIWAVGREARQLVKESNGRRALILVQGRTDAAARERFLVEAVGALDACLEMPNDRLRPEELAPLKMGNRGAIDPTEVVEILRVKKLFEKWAPRRAPSGD